MRFELEHTDNCSTRNNSLVERKMPLTTMHVVTIPLAKKWLMSPLRRQEKWLKVVLVCKVLSFSILLTPQKLILSQKLLFIYALDMFLGQFFNIILSIRLIFLFVLWSDINTLNMPFLWIYCLAVNYSSIFGFIEYLPWISL